MLNRPSNDVSQDDCETPATGGDHAHCPHEPSLAGDRNPVAARPAGADVRPVDDAIRALFGQVNGCSRRAFCQTAGVGLVTLGLAACDPGAGKLAVGGIDNPGPGVGGNGQVADSDGGDDNGNGGNGGSGGGGGDGGSGGSGGGGGSGGSGGSVDMAGQPPGDMAHGTNCTPGSTSAGNKSSYQLNTPKVVSNKYIVVQDSGGFYAMNAICPHAQCTINDFGTAGSVICDCHGAEWTINGENGQGPRGAKGSTLQHYALCIDATGNITITSTKVDTTQRY
jgi:nitrite reductase/ring-hydroxylating ferredoxin subunit